MQEIKNFCGFYLSKSSIYFDGIWYAVESFWSDEFHTHFILSDQ